jgi:hypothetical protein
LLENLERSKNYFCDFFKYLLIAYISDVEMKPSLLKVKRNGIAFVYDKVVFKILNAKRST